MSRANLPITGQAESLSVECTASPLDSLSVPTFPAPAHHLLPPPPLPPLAPHPPPLHLLLLAMSTLSITITPPPLISFRWTPSLIYPLLMSPLEFAVALKALGILLFLF